MEGRTRMNSTKQKLAAKKFVEHWTGKGYEKGESQAFWISLLRLLFDAIQKTKVLP